MSFQAMSWAIGLKLPTREKFVLLMLANYASNEHGECYPSLSRLAEDTGMVNNTVIAAIQRLEEMGVLAVQRRQSGGVNLPNVYRLNLAWRGSAPDEPLVHLVRGGSAPDAHEPITEPITKKKEESGRERVTFLESNYTLQVPAPILEAWKTAYPAVNVEDEIHRASSWLATNPTRRPKRDFGRFMNGWLNRASTDRRVINRRETKADRREAFMEGLFGPAGGSHVVDVVATVVG
jgi:DNA-binding transcriptional MocR family regulator